MQVVHATGADWHCLVPSRKRLAYLKAGEMALPPWKWEDRIEKL